MSDYSIEVVFSFDTTGSMYPCLTQVRRKVKETVTRLLTEIPGMRIGIIAHGDYCDKGSSYVTKHFKLSDDAAAICKFVQEVGPTGGGDLPECYELVLHEAQSLNWLKPTKKALVLIGDDIPHGPKDNPGKLNWRDEVDKLTHADLRGDPAAPREAAPRPRATGIEEEARIRALEAANSQMATELAAIRGMIERQLAGFAWGELNRTAPSRTRLMSDLLEAGFSAALARELADAVPEDASVEDASVSLTATVGVGRVRRRARCEERGRHQQHEG